MRIDAIVLTTAFAFTAPLAAMADTLFENENDYHVGYDSALSQFYVTPTLYGDGVAADYQPVEVAYPFNDDGYVANETPVAYQVGPNLGYAAGTENLYGQTIITEVIDGIVYETLVSGPSPELQSPQNYQSF